MVTSVNFDNENYDEKCLFIGTVIIIIGTIRSASLITYNVRSVVLP